MTTLALIANDISCDHCKRSIEGDLAGQPGVRSVSVDVEAKAVRIDYDEAETTPESLRRTLADSGYPAS